MAITTNSVSLTTYPGSVGDMIEPTNAFEEDKTTWALNAVSADARSHETIRAAPGADTALYLEYLVLSCDANITITLGDGEDTTSTGNIETIQLGPIPFGTAGGVVTLDLRGKPLKLTDNEAFTVDASGAGNLCLYAEGFTYP